PLVTIPFLARLAGIEQSPLPSWLIGISTLMAIYGAILWFMADNALEGRPYWIITTAAFMFIAALKHQPAGVLSWGFIMISSGAGIFLCRLRNRYWTFWIVIQVLILCGIPFTPMWDLTRLYQDLFTIWTLGILFAHLLLVGGFFRHYNQIKNEPIMGEKWVSVLYGIGLSLLFFIPILIGYSGWSQLLQSDTGYSYDPSRSFLEYWSGLILLVCFLIAVLLQNVIQINLPKPNLQGLDLLNFGWVLAFLRWVFRKFSGAFIFLDQIFEGQGGILWAFLVLILLGGFLYLVVAGG
ncbi:MAG: hypothetical protein ACPL0B_03155, partial [Anaerolineales bacterium]